MSLTTDSLFQSHIHFYLFFAPSHFLNCNCTYTLYLNIINFSAFHYFYFYFFFWAERSSFLQRCFIKRTKEFIFVCMRTLLLKMKISVGKKNVTFPEEINEMSHTFYWPLFADPISSGVVYFLERLEDGTFCWTFKTQVSQSVSWTSKH